MTDTDTDTATRFDVEPAAPTVEVRRNGALAAAVASVAGLVAAAYLARAVSTGGWLDWAVFLVMGLLALAHARSWRDARTPLLVADVTGIRMRLGRAWHGLPWEDLEEVEHAPRQGLLRDGRLVAFPIDQEASLASLDPVARRQAGIAQRVHGAPFALPLGLTTTVTGADEGLTQALLALAPDARLVVEVVPGADEAPDQGSPEGGPAAEASEYGEVPARAAADDQETGEITLAPPAPDAAYPGAADPDAADPDATVIRPNPFRRAAEAARAARGAHAARSAVNWAPAVAAATDTGNPETTENPGDLGDDRDLAETRVRPVALVATRTPSPLREPSHAVRADVTRQAPAPGSQVGAPVAVGTAARHHADDVVGDPEDTGVWRSTTVVVAELAGPAHDPVVGPQLTAAREALGLGVDQLAERTRIRAHVIEAIEADDFTPCGGDFYARGHLRTLARVLHVDAGPLLATYDQTYAAAPIEARRVFEAELSTGSGGSIRSLRGGPNWSVIVAAVMAVVLAWSVARLVMDQPRDAASDSPSLSSGSAGLTSGTTDLPPAVPVVLTAEGGGAKVVVRDGAGEVLFKGDLAFGQSRTVQVAPPIRVQTSDGSLTVGVDGQDAERMGLAGRPARDTFVP